MKYPLFVAIAVLLLPAALFAASDSSFHDVAGALAPRGTFFFDGSGTDGIPDGGLFAGIFTSATWNLVPLSDGTHEYALTAALKETPANETSADAAMVRFIADNGMGYFTSGVELASGENNVVAPEPGTLGLLGTGLLGVAAIIRSRLHPPGQSG